MSAPMMFKSAEAVKECHDLLGVKAADFGRARAGGKGGVYAVNVKSDIDGGVADFGMDGGGDLFDVPIYDGIHWEDFNAEGAHVVHVGAGKEGTANANLERVGDIYEFFFDGAFHEDCRGYIWSRNKNPRCRGGHLLGGRQRSRGRR